MHSSRRPTASPSKTSYWQDQWDVAVDAVTAPHPLRIALEGEVARFALEHVRALEVGTGVGQLSGLTEFSVGIDISSNCAVHHLPGRFVVATAEGLPFCSETFGFVYSIYTLEHVSLVGQALEEIRRTAANRSYVYLKPAWFCRPWAGRPWYHKAWSACTLRERVLRTLVLVRNSLVFRACDLAQWRARGIARYWLSSDRAALPFRSRRLQPNYELTHVIDADAETWIDPLDVILWFEGRGDRCLSHTTAWRKLTARASAVAFSIAHDKAIDRSPDSRAVR